MTADLRREEIARILTRDEEAKVRESVRLIAALPVEDSGLQWTNDAMARLLATLDRDRNDHLRWVAATYGRDSADSVLLYKSTHAKLEAAWAALANVAQWDAWADKRLAELQAMDTDDFPDRLIATDAARSQDTATARIAALEGALRKIDALAAELVDLFDRATMPGDDSTPLYDYLATDARRTVDEARAVLSGETRHDPSDHDCKGGVRGDKYPLSGETRTDPTIVHPGPHCGCIYDDPGRWGERFDRLSGAVPHPDYASGETRTDGETDR